MTASRITRWVVPILFAVPITAQTGNWVQQTPTASPSPRSGHAMVYDSAHGQVVLFGGTGGVSMLNDTWIWDGSKWTQTSPQTSPPARYGHAMAYDSSHKQVVLFGGNSGGTLSRNDTWTWNGNNWTQQSPQTSP